MRRGIARLIPVGRLFTPLAQRPLPAAPAPRSTVVAQRPIGSSKRVGMTRTSHWSTPPPANNLRKIRNRTGNCLLYARAPGTQSFTSVPTPGSLRTTTLPPATSARSCIPPSPKCPCLSP